jgi:hypothetical protein
MRKLKIKRLKNIKNKGIDKKRYKKSSIKHNKLLVVLLGSISELLQMPMD